MPTIARTKLNDFINQTNGRIFTATFQKKDNTWRDLNGRKGVTQHLKGGVNKVVSDSNGYIVMFDMQKREYRTLNLDTVTRIKFKKQTYQIV